MLHSSVDSLVLKALLERLLLRGRQDQAWLGEASVQNFRKNPVGSSSQLHSHHIMECFLSLQALAASIVRRQGGYHQIAFACRHV